MVDRERNTPSEMAEIHRKLDHPQDPDAELKIILAKLLSTHGVPQEIIAGKNYAFESCENCKQAITALKQWGAKQAKLELLELTKWRGAMFEKDVRAYLDERITQLEKEAGDVKGS